MSLRQHYASDASAFAPAPRNRYLLIRRTPDADIDAERRLTRAYADDVHQAEAVALAMKRLCEMAMPQHG